MCTTDSPKIGVLNIDSLDPDTMDRTVSPLVLTAPDDHYDYSNVVNSFMDHVWDGFYTGQKRMTRFPVIVPDKSKIHISYTGTPPENQKF